METVLRLVMFAPAIACLWWFARGMNPDNGSFLNTHPNVKYLIIFVGCFEIAMVIQQGISAFLRGNIAHTGSLDGFLIIGILAYIAHVCTKCVPKDTATQGEIRPWRP